MKLFDLIKRTVWVRQVLTVAVIASLAGKTRAGSIERFVYYDSGSAVASLTNNLYFPGTPSDALQLDDYSLDHGVASFGLQSKDDGADFGSQGIGTYAIGYLEAPTNGNYTFFIASDNASQLWLSTNETVVGIQLIAQETNSGTALFSGPRLSQRESAPVPLQGAHKYYLQVLHQANSAVGSHVQVGWQRPDGVQEIIPALHLAQYPVNLVSGATYTAPQFNPQPPGFYGNLGDLPPLVATNEGSALNLQVDVIAAQPTGFQWYSNRVAVAGANLSYLAFPAVRATANNAVFQVVVTNVYGALTSSPVTLAITPDTTAPTVVQVSPQGNPNGVIVNFSKPVDPITSTAVANYALQAPGGASVAINSATLLPGQQSVELAGTFNFQSGATYQLTVAGVLDQDSTPNTLSPNPTIKTFAYGPSPGTFYNLTNAPQNSFSLFGYAAIVTNNAYDDGGYVDLTDPAQFEKGVIQFPANSTVDHFDLSFKTSISQASATPGDGFSIDLAADLPAGTFLHEQAGYSSITTPSGNRLEVAFNNDRTVNSVLTPAISVVWQGNVVTNIPTGTGGIPPINSTDGHWAPVDLNLKRGGALSLSFDGVQIFTNLATGFVPIPSTLLDIAAQTATNYETHWFHDITVNYAAGDLGPVAFVNNPSLTNIAALENSTANFAVVPSGESPYFYQWYFNGTALSGANSSILSVIANANTAGNYFVVVSNWFSQATSVTASLTVTPDTTPPYLVSARGLAAGINEVVLKFSKPLNLVSATNTATYILGLLALNSASLSADGETVTLSTGTLERNQLYLFSINNLQDNTLEHNQLTTSASFVTTVDYAAQIGLDGSIRYWRFDDPVGSSTATSLTTGADASSLGVATFNGSPTLGVPSLIPSEPQDPGILLTAATGDWLLAPNGVDINTAGPYAQKTIEFWFNANSLPAPGATGVTAAAGLFEEGAQTRGLNFYLWRDPSDPNPDEAQLVLNAFDNAKDGPGSPWGTSEGPPSPTPPVYVQTTVQAGQTYHVVGVFNGNAQTNGTLSLYVNGVLVSTAGGVGLLYAHTGDNEIGKGNNLLHTGDYSVLANYDGVLDDLSLYDTALSAGSVLQHYLTGVNGVSSASLPAVSRLDTLGNPNQVLVTFTKPVSLVSATNLTNYVLARATGPVIPITNAILLGGSSTVQLQGSCGFQVNSNYTLTVANVTDQSVPANVISPNPTNVTFPFSASTGTLFTFSNGLPSGVQIAGSTYVTNTGGYAGDGFVDLTDSVTNENGALLFSDRHDVYQADITFKARLANGSTPPGAGFSVNISQDFPNGTTFTTPERGYLPDADPSLVVAFDNQSNNPPSISVLWQGVAVTNVLTGTNGIPPLASSDGHWANVEINLLLSGLINVNYDGVTVITNLATGFQPLIGAQVGFGARTTASAYETHWFDDINLNFAPGSIGPVTIPAAGQPQGSTNLENQVVSLAVTPAGTAPFVYQWYYTNAPLAGATNRSLTFLAHTNVTGAYYVKVSDNFSTATSAVAAVAVQTDLLPAALTNVVAYGGSLNKVLLAFNKPLLPASATNLGNYRLDSGGLLIYSATLGTNATAITLVTSSQQNAYTNTLNISGLLNQAAFPHPLNTNVTFVTGVSYYQEALSDNPVRYVRFDETNGATANSDVSVLDSLATAAGTYENGVVLGQTPLIPNSTGNSVLLNSASNNYVSFTASEKDISSGTFTNRTVEFWFKAASLPYAQADEYGNVTNNHAPPLWIEGAGARYFSVYLYGTDSTTTNPSSALLILNAGNLVGTDGGGVGTPWGATNSAPYWAVWVGTSVTTGQVYHVVAQLQGSNVLGSGQLLLYTNSVLVGTNGSNLIDASGNPLSGSGPSGGPGLLYGHTGGALRVGVGSGAWRHDGVVFSGSDYYNGWFDDLVIYNTVLSPQRIATHYQVGLTPPLVPRVVPPPAPPVIGKFSVSSGGFNLSWTGTAQLQRATNVAGPFTTVTGATSPYYEPTTNQQVFFRLVQ